MPIGLVGLSGSTEYPHLHFSVRRLGAKIDPFSSSALPGQCNSNPGTGLWSSATRLRLPYAPAEIVRLAITNAPQPVPIIGDLPSPSRREPLVVVADVIAPQRGDTYLFNLIGPKGEKLLTRQATVERPYLNWGPYAGVNAPPGGWSGGRYIGRFSLSRNGRVVAQAEYAVTL